MKDAKELRWIYPALGLLAAFSVAGAAWVDAFLQLNSVFETGCKLLILAVLLGYAKLRGELRQMFRFRPSRGVLFLALLLPAAFSLRGLCPFDLKPSAVEVVTSLLGVFSTALWEELFFRYLGMSWFSREKKISLSNLLFLALVFSLPHAINILIHPVWFQLLVAALSAVFFLALYCEGGILLAVLSHTILNGISALLSLFASEASLGRPYLGLGICDYIGIVCLVSEAAIGFYLLKKHAYLS